MMQTKTVRVKKLAHFKGALPQYETLHASGVDVRAQLNQTVVLAAGERVLVPTGLAVEIPPGWEIQMRPRSGWAAKQGVSLPNTPGTIDADYRGEIKVIVINLGQQPVEIHDQDRIAQMVLCPVAHIEWQEVGELGDTERGAGGFGSTGRA